MHRSAACARAETATGPGLTQSDARCAGRMAQVV
jgi:hypothetical protein